MGGLRLSCLIKLGRPLAVISAQEVGEDRVVAKGDAGVCFGPLVVAVISKKGLDLS